MTKDDLDGLQRCVDWSFEHQEISRARHRELTRIIQDQCPRLAQPVDERANTLEAAWKAYRDNKNAPGLDNVDGVYIAYQAFEAAWNRRAPPLWQPISTAPSATWVQVWNGHYQSVALYDYVNSDEQDWTDGGDAYIRPLPTHWMPLPKPPKEGKS